VTPRIDYPSPIFYKKYFKGSLDIPSLIPYLGSMSMMFPMKNGATSSLEGILSFEPYQPMSDYQRGSLERFYGLTDEAVSSVLTKKGGL
jgi:hypothetical protein